MLTWWYIVHCVGERDKKCLKWSYRSKGKLKTRVNVIVCRFIYLSRIKVSQRWRQGFLHVMWFLWLCSFSLHSDPKPEQSVWVWTLWGGWSGVNQWQPLCRPHLPPSHQAHGEHNRLSPNAHQKVQKSCLNICFLLKLDGTDYSFYYLYNPSFMGKLKLLCRRLG